MPRDKTRVLVLFGGRSSEHEVSVRSASSVIAALDAERFEAIPLAIDRNGRWLHAERSAALLPTEIASACRLGSVRVSHEPGRSHGFDIAFPALHGPYGEDGRIQGLFDMAGIPYVGSGVLGSACGMDKDIMKRLVRERGMPTLRHVVVWPGQADARAAEIEGRIGYPAFVKPANLGSSVGIRRVLDRSSLVEAVLHASEFDRKVIVERGVDAREIECAVLGNDAPEASVPAEIVTPGGFYDYQAKYITDEAQLLVPAALPAEQATAIRGLAVDAFAAIGCSGLARVDFFIERGSGRVLINEVNTMPGFTSISMFPRMWAASGIPYPRLVERLIELGFERHRETGSLRTDVS